MALIALFVSATKLAGILVTVSVAANAFSFSSYRRKNLSDLSPQSMSLPLHSPTSHSTVNSLHFFSLKIFALRVLLVVSRGFIIHWVTLYLVNYMCKAMVHLMLERLIDSISEVLTDFFFFST